MTDLIRVLICDDHYVVRQGLATLLAPRNGMEVVGEAANLMSQKHQRAAEMWPFLLDGNYSHHLTLLECV